MDLDFEDIPLLLTAILVLLGVLLQLMFWFPCVFSTLIPNSTLEAFSPFVLLASLVLFAFSGWHLAVIIREWFSAREDFNRYISAQLNRLEKRVDGLERSLGAFQRLMLNQVETLKTQISNVTSLSKLSTLEKPIPTKQQLNLLRNQLGIEKGSLQYRSSSIYLVAYDSRVKKHFWNRLGSWSELKQKLHDEKPS